MNSQNCSFDNNILITCSFTFTEKGIYYLKTLTSTQNTLKLKPNLSSQIRIGLTECNPTLPTEVSRKMFIPRRAVGCQPEVVSKKQNEDIFYKLDCFIDLEDGMMNCYFPSFYQVKGSDEKIQLASRKKCGKLSELLNPVIAVFDISIEGDTYINQVESTNIQHYYMITTTKSQDATLYSLKENEEAIHSIPLTKCKAIQTTFPYKYNCTLSKEKSLEPGFYNLYYGDTMYVTNVVTIYEPKPIYVSIVHL